MNHADVTLGGICPERVIRWKETTSMAPNNAVIQKTTVEHRDSVEGSGGKFQY